MFIRHYILGDQLTDARDQDPASAANDSKLVRPSALERAAEGDGGQPEQA